MLCTVKQSTVCHTAKDVTSWFVGWLVIVHLSKLCPNSWIN